LRGIRPLRRREIVNVEVLSAALPVSRIELWAVPDRRARTTRRRRARDLLTQIDG